MADRAERRQFSKMQRARFSAGIGLCVLGGIWCLQGIGWLKGSFMTGDTTWLMIGVVLVAVGASLLAAHVRSVKRDG